MERAKHWVQKLADSADLPGELLPGMPLVEIAGQGRVLIEGHGGVSAYSREKICVQVRYGQVCITGCCLELVRMSREQLVICGKISSVQLFGRNG